MTEQPTETQACTEQVWLGNTPGAVTRFTVPRSGLADVTADLLPVRNVGDDRGLRAVAPMPRSGLADKFLGLVDTAFDKADNDMRARRATDPGLRRLDADIAAARPAPARPAATLELQAEIAAGHALRALEDGHLSEGIAWLQSALAMAQNHRHALTESPKQ